MKAERAERCRAMLVMAAVGALGACTGGPGTEAGAGAQQYAELEVGATADGAEVELGADQVLTVKLLGRPATGHGWHVTSIDPDLLALGDTVLAPGAVLGGTDLQVFHFLGRGAGTAELVLTYGRAWEPGAGQRFRLRVRVAGPYRGPFHPAAAARLAGGEALASAPLPAAYDLCAQGGCTPVKDQGACGSCWAFAQTAVVESALKRADGVTRDLSEQYVVSCNAQGYSCSGGWTAFDLYRDHVPAGDAGAGTVHAADFPYRAQDVPCGSGPRPHREQLVAWSSVAATDPTTLKQALLEHGALWVTVCADGPFSEYRSGVFAGAPCEAVNHAVALVGWDDALGAWRIKNSWGTGWGDGGYMRIAYGANLVASHAYWVSYTGADTTCVDRALDGDETDVDCGGEACPRCGEGKRCRRDSDCAPGAVCPAGVCSRPTTPCGDLCGQPEVFSGAQFQSGSLGAAARCHETTAPLAGGACGGFVGTRRLLVNGQAMDCASGRNWTLPRPRNGGWCIQTTAGDATWAWFVTW